jgi:type IV secretion system protein VirB10
MPMNGSATRKHANNSPRSAPCDCARRSEHPPGSRAPATFAANGAVGAVRGNPPPSLSGQIAALYAADARRQLQLANGDDEEDINRAAAKRAFLADREPQGPTGHYLRTGREAPLSPYEVKAGTVIPAIMIGGVNSDLPGQIIGQVSENVYDSATGRYILIPQGSKLVGIYDNGVITGQQRVLVAWTRIIFPDMPPPSISARCRARTRAGLPVSRTG